MKGQIDAGKLRVLAVFQQGKYDLLPDAKPIGETPWKDTFPVGYYVIAPNGLPKPVLDKLMAVSKTIVESDEFKSFLKANGYTWDPKIGDDMKKELAGLRRQVPRHHQIPGRRQVTPARSFGLPPARRFTGLLALLLAAVYVVDAWQTLSFGRWHKPGAAIFPIAVGAAAGDLGDLGSAREAWRRRRSDAGDLLAAGRRRPAPAARWCSPRSRSTSWRCRSSAT